REGLGQLPDVRGRARVGRGPLGSPSFPRLLVITGHGQVPLEDRRIGLRSRDQVLLGERRTAKRRGLPGLLPDLDYVPEPLETVMDLVGAALGAPIDRLQELADIGAGVERLVDVLLDDRQRPMDYRVHVDDEDHLAALVELLVL